MRALRIMLILFSIFLLFSLAFADMPASFYQAMSDVKTEDTLCVKNYDAGASVTESYKDFEHLEKETEVVSRSYNTSNSEKDYTRGNASLEVNINSNIIGKAHIAWQSKDMMSDYMAAMPPHTWHCPPGLAALWLVPRCRIKIITFYYFHQ